MVDTHPEDELDAFAALRPGGIVVRRQHTRRPAQVQERIPRHQALAAQPLLVAANFNWIVRLFV